MIDISAAHSKLHLHRILTVFQTAMLQMYSQLLDCTTTNGCFEHPWTPIALFRAAVAWTRTNTMIITTRVNLLQYDSRGSEPVSAHCSHMGTMTLQSIMQAMYM